MQQTKLFEVEDDLSTGPLWRRVFDRKRHLSQARPFILAATDWYVSRKSLRYYTRRSVRSSNALHFNDCRICGVRFACAPQFRVPAWDRTWQSGDHRLVVQAFHSQSVCMDCLPLWHGRKKEPSIRHAAYEWLKANAACVDCGGHFAPGAMEFDHLPQYEKVADMSVMLYRPLAEFIDELSKCEVVCANCHRIRTAKRTRTNDAWATGEGQR